MGIYEKEILNSHELDGMITRLAFQILEKCKECEQVKLVGIERRGAVLATRIKDKIKEFKNIDLEIGFLDITLYRDDLTELADFPILKGTVLPFDVRDKEIVLIDDVIFTGRTARAAMDAIIDYGRPKRILFAVLIDRGHRELPIQPDFTGKYVPTSLDERINVKVKEIDGIDSVTISKKID